MKTKTQAKRTKKISPEIAADLAKQKATQYFQGKIEATRVFKKAMDGFSKKQGNQCNANMWMILNDTHNTVTYSNTYSEENLPKASYNPETYTYPIKEKVIKPKLESMIQVEPDQWPPFVTHAKRSRK